MKALEILKAIRRSVVSKFNITENRQWEIVSLFLLLLIAALLACLLSYSPDDPSFHNDNATENVKNLFGVAGAHLSGGLVKLFGPAAFLIPGFLFLSLAHFYARHKNREIATTMAGGLILTISTAGLLAFRSEPVILFGNPVTAGGAGISFKNIIVANAGGFGAAIVLVMLWNVGFILMTGVSALTFVRQCRQDAVRLTDRLKKYLVDLKDGKRKLRRMTVFERPAGGFSRGGEVGDKKSKLRLLLEIPERLGSEPAPSGETEAQPGEAETQTGPESVSVEEGFQMPGVEFLEQAKARPASTGNANLQIQSQLLEKKLEDFGVKGKVVNVIPGPVITTFEYKPAPGVKINKIVNLTDDLALALRAMSIRIVAPIPGKAVIGIEIPNDRREMVRFREVIGSGEFGKSKSKLAIALGKDIIGNPVVTELDKMPHLLIAGATGAGKSVSLNSIICSLLYKSSPEDVKLILIDPKRIELSIYDDIPHLIAPVVTDAKQATAMLFRAVSEMDRRYERLSEMKVRNIRQYNRKIGRGKKLPYIVIIIDELADLMMVASKNVEFAMMRLAQMARAAGIHLIFATQRPSVNVLTGVIKANFPTRLSFQVSSKIDSRTIIDTNGAESLLGNGDMLFQPPGTARLQRIHGAYISEDEITKITDFLKKQKLPEYDETILRGPDEAGNGKNTESSKDEEFDEKYDEAVAYVTDEGKATIAMVQRRFRIGYKRASKIIDQMEKEGVVGPGEGGKPRDILVRGYNVQP